MRYGVEWVTKKRRRRHVRMFDTWAEARRFEEQIEPGVHWSSAFTQLSEDELGGAEAFDAAVSKRLLEGRAQSVHGDGWSMWFPGKGSRDA